MICERCTLENPATARVCEACQAPLLHHTKMKEKAPATGTLLNCPLDAALCHRCGFPIDPHARTCLLCDDPFPSAPLKMSAPVIDVDDDGAFPSAVIDLDDSDDDCGEIDDSNSEIECPNCTLLHKRGSHVCAACPTLLTLFHDQHFGASSSHAPEGRTRAKSAGKVCFSCMFLNHRLETACVACGNSFKDVGTIKCVGVDDNESDEIVCKKCTLLNKADASVCGACSTPLDSYHDQSFMVHDGASSSHRPFDNIGGKFMCIKCMFWNDMPVTVCACCNSDLVAEGEGMEEQMIVCQTCKGEFKSKSSGYELMSCNHGFCKPCLWASVTKHLLPLTGKNHEGLPDDGLNVECPVEGCGRTLSREDLRLVAGPEILSLLDEWRMAVLAQKVIDPVIHRCPHCKELMLPSDQLHSLDRKSLRRALEKIGISPPSERRVSKSILVQQLQGAVPSLLCSSCFLLLCENCGAGLKSASLLDAAHQCDPSLKQCFDIARSIMKLCSAYVQAAQSPARKTCKHSGTSIVTRNNSSNQDRVAPSSVDNKGLTSESIISWFLEKNLEVMFEVEGTDFQGQEMEEKADDKAAVSLRKRRMASVVVDKQAQEALQELTSGILNILNDHQGALSPSVVALLCSHDLPFTLLRWLVRNDSIIDITARSDLYWEVLSLMRALSSSWDLLPLFCSREAKHDCWATQCRWETPGCIMSDFGKLFKQAQFILQRSEHLLLFDEKDEKGKTVLEQGAITASLVADVEATFQLLCKRIKVWEGKTSQHQWLADTISKQHLAAAGRNKGRLMSDDEQRKHTLIYFIDQKSSILKGDSSASPSTSHILKRCSRQAHTKQKSSRASDDRKQEHDDPKHECDDAAVPSAALVEAYKKALRPFQFDEVCLLPTHYFRMTVQDIGTMMSNKKRARAISEELVQLNTILPLEWESSIFLRMDKQRSDMLRALIIGPKGTPYENGVFLFDLLLQESYPEKPPLVQFLTTGAGRVRFNPNLYECGKVCLSLLGTWNGPGWKPGESTIMQVLVSIQALVLVENPYYNEPGYERLGNDFHAEIYLHEQRLNTVLYSMLPALRSPDPVFLPVIHTHFRLKAPHILHQCNTWIEQESRSNIKESLSSSFEELSLELKKLTSAPLP